MRLLGLLKELINHDKNTDLYGAILKKVGYAEAIIVAYFSEEQMSLEFLQSLIDNYTDEASLEEKIRYFLTLRWRAMWGSNLDYISFPHGFLNQLCYKLAQNVVKADESLIQVLIPTITVTDYTIVSEDLCGLTETKGDNTIRELAFGNFLISDDGKAVIPIKEWFESQIKTQEKSFQHVHVLDSPTQPLLTEREIQLLRNCAKPTSESFFEEYSLRKSLMTAQGTLAEAVYNLCEGLINNGVSRTKNAAFAHDDVYTYIRLFSEILERLTPEQRDSIFKLKHDEQTFATYWSYISAYNGKERSWAWSESSPCVVEMSKGFRGLLDKNIELFSSIRISPQVIEDADANKVITPFDDVIQAIEEKITARKLSLQQFLKTRTSKDGENAVFLPHEARNVLRLSNVLRVHKIALSSKLPLEYGKWELEYYVYRSRFYEVSFFDKILKREKPDTLNRYFDEALDRSPMFACLLVTKPYVPIQPAMFFRIISEGHVSILRSYIQADKNINFTNAESETALFVALKEDQIEIAETLIRAGGNLDNSCVEEEGLLLHFLIKKRAMSLIKALLSGVDYNINAINSQGNSALYYAVEQENMNLLVLLLANGANLAIKNKKGESPLDVALRTKNQSLIIHMISAGAPIVNLKIPLMVQLINNPLENAAQFVQSLVWYDIKQDGEALRYVAKSAMSTMLNLLLAKGVEVSLADEEGNQALHMAADIDSVNLLLSYKADPNAMNKRGELPLHRAILMRNIPCILGISRVTTNKYMKDIQGSTPVILALKHATNDNYAVAYNLLHSGDYPFSRELVNDLKCCSKAKLDGLLDVLAMEESFQIKSLISAGGYSKQVSYNTLNKLGIVFELQDILTHPNLLQLHNQYGFEELCHLTNITLESPQGLQLYATIVAQRLPANQKNELKTLLAQQPLKVKDLWQALLRTRSVISPFWSYFDPINDMPRPLRQYAMGSDGLTNNLIQKGCIKGMN